MADFKTKLLTLAGAATLFSGMAFGQVNCTNAVVSAAAGSPSANAVFLRAEGKTEQVADMTFKCDTGTALAATSSMTVTVYLSPAVTITSKVTDATTTPPTNEASAVVGGVTYPGQISNNSVAFTIPTPVTTVGTMTIVVTNIKVDATAIATGSGVPTAITETVFVGGTGAVPAVLSTTPAVAFVSAGLSASSIKSAGVTANPICNPLAGTNFTVAFAENFGTAFKLRGSLAGNVALNSWFTNNTETGFATTPSNLASFGTRVKIVFNNIPSGVAFYVPTAMLATTGGGSMALTTSETGAFAIGTVSTAAGAPASSTALTVTSGTATAIYEYRGVQAGAAPAQLTAALAGTVGTSDATAETFTVPVTLVAVASTVPGPAGAITATVSFAPIGATQVPNFVSGSSTTTVSGSTFTACSTTLLFPYVTNQAGFESGIAVSNASADLLGGTATTPASSVTTQTGTCTFTFFGNSTATSNPAAFTTSANVAAGTTWTGTLTSIAGGTAGNFGGYMIVKCNFLFAHGFTYITYDIGKADGMAMGYVALPLGTPRATPTTGGPESLGN